MSADELIALGKQWLEHSPPAKPGAPDLIGFSNPLAFVCSECSGRILGRGCALGVLARNPVWKGDAVTVAACQLCEKPVA